MNAAVASSHHDPVHKSGSESGLQTVELFDALEHARNERTRQEICDELIIRTLPIADRLASHYKYRGVAIDDLQQVARAALVQAMRRFRGGGESAFLAFAIPSIRGELKRHFRDRGWTVRPPRRVQEARLAIVNAHDQLIQELGHEPSVSELAIATGFDEDTIREAQGVGHCYQPDSFDRPFDDSDGARSFGDSKGEVDPGFEQAEARVAIGPLLDQLAPRDRKLIMLRFFEGLTQRETGRQIGISQMQVSRVESRILNELRLFLAPDEAA
jgi:RNA polymerase sigma-B factor